MSKYFQPLEAVKTNWNQHRYHHDYKLPISLCQDNQHPNHGHRSEYGENTCKEIGRERSQVL